MDKKHTVNNCFLTPNISLQNAGLYLIFPTDQVLLHHCLPTYVVWRSLENAHNETHTLVLTMLYLSNVVVNVENPSGQGAEDVYYYVSSHL